jgi:Zn-dependent protease with chaperone function
MAKLIHVLVFIGALLLAALLAWFLNWLALRLWRRSVDAHWTERARLLYPVRTSASLNIVLIPIGMVLAQQALPDEWRLYWPLCACASFCGALAGTYQIDCAVFPSLRFMEWAGLAVRGWLVRLSLIGGGICLVRCMPQDFGWRTFLLGTIAVAVLLAMNFGLPIRIGRILGLIEPASARLAGLVAETSIRMNLRFKQVWLMKSPIANAGAFVTTREMVFTSGLLENLTDEEVKAICSHEMGHLSESSAIVFWRLAGAYMFLPLLFIRPLSHTFGEIGPLAACVFVLVSICVSGRFKRRLEVRADKAGQGNEAEEGLYARALERLYKVNLMPAVMPGKRAVHPHLYDRMVASGVAPAYARPKAPSKLGLQTLVLIALAGIAGLIACYAQFGRCCLPTNGGRTPTGMMPNVQQSPKPEGHQSEP